MDRAEEGDDCAPECGLPAGFPFFPSEGELRAEHWIGVEDGGKVVCELETSDDIAAEVATNGGKFLVIEE
jgi:hypothetical protein